MDHVGYQLVLVLPHLALRFLFQVVDNLMCIMFTILIV